MQKITPNLWFDHQAEEAARFYTSIFRNSQMGRVMRYGEAASQVSEAISFMVKCYTQHEADEFWGKLSDGGKEQPCGWLKDRYGVSWQIVPTMMEEMLHDKDPARSERVWKALLQMKKIDIATLQAAADGRR